MDGQVPLITLLSRALMTRCLQNGQKFLPREDLNRICTAKNVRRELVRCFTEDDDFVRECTATMFPKQDGASSHPPKRYLEIFAILVLIQQLQLIKEFLQQGISDHHLPFSRNDQGDQLWSCPESETVHLGFLDGDHNIHIQDLIFWKQWCVHVPFFGPPDDPSLDFNVYNLPQETVIPLTYVSARKSVGGFGVVQKVKIHHQHHGFRHASFALKTLRPDIDEQREKFFNQEIEAFRKARPRRHLVEMCAALKIGPDRSFLFPWAKGGTMKELWDKSPTRILKPKKVKGPEFSRWICIQCHGIIRDLREIHEPHGAQAGQVENLYGIHSDIKPDNILYFSQDEDHQPLGVLKVADLGLMKFHRLISRTMQSPSMAICYQTYRSPESERDLGGMRSRKIDIWAFGCLFAELLTWVVCGPAGIEDFQNMRVNEDKRFPDEQKGDWAEDNFFIMRPSITKLKKIPKLKSSVGEWFKALVERLGPGSENTFLPCFINYIQHRMLHPDRDSRDDCKKVEEFLYSCLTHGPETQYWLLDESVQGQGSNSRRTTDRSA